MKLKISKSAVKNIGKQVFDEGEQLDIINRKINTVMEDLSLNWEGPDCTKITTLLREIYIPNLNQLSTQVKGYGNYLQGVNKPYKQLDDSYSGKKLGK